jgi:ABC-type nitrate/sulfonate/bicarbonate transport system substrate-binding protein
MKLKSLLQIGTLSVFASFLASPNAATTVRVGLSQPTYSFIPFDVGLKSGVCKSPDVEYQKTVFSGSAQLHQALTADSVDIGLGAGPEMGFLSKGAPEKAIAAMSDAPEDLALVVLKDSGINQIADLKGKRISMSTKGSLTEWAAGELMLQQGWGKDGMKMIPLGSFSAQTAALKTKQIDGMIVEAGTAGRLEEEGSSKTLLKFGKVVPKFHIHVMYATNKLITSNPDATKKFLKCWFDGLDYMKTHKTESVKIASETLNMSVDLSGKLYDSLMPHFNYSGKFDAQALEVISQSLVDTGIMSTKQNLSKYYTEEFLPKR